DLLFCPDFTVTTNKKSGPDKHEDLQSIDSCEFIWEAGVGFAHSPPHVPAQDINHTEILKLILTCFSQSIYQASSADATDAPNRWITVFTSADNRHALPLFTSLLNVVCGYNPVGFGVPYNHLLFSDSREPLVEVALQILITTLDHDITAALSELEESAVPDNLFINYLSRIHREEDFSFVLRGFTRLLNNPLQQTYLPHSAKKVNFHQELMVFFWKFCDYNK
ncbi:HID1-like 2, partial [Homarus americanus]